MTSSMRAQWLLGMMVTGLGLIGACDGARQVPRHDGGVPPGGDAGPNHDAGIPIGGHDSGPCNSTDSNNDGIADLLQNVAMSDQDNDTISNMVENLAWLDPWPRGSMTHPPAPQLCAPTDCDSDGMWNFVDLDSDNDGLPDSREAMIGTNECNPDTDGDGITDLVEDAAGTNPSDPTSMPPATSLYVTIPYWPPTGPAGDHPQRMFSFSTRIQVADVFILVDNSNSMDPIINALRNTFSSTIVPGIRAQIPDVRLGVGSFDSVPDCQPGNPFATNCDGSPGSPGDYTLWVRQRLDANAALTQTAFNNMQTVAHTSGGGFVGGDDPEDSLEAIYESVAGSGMAGHLADEAARRSVHNAADPSGDGWVPTMDPVRDCGAAPDAPQPFGWACFQDGRVPIVVLASDNYWWNGSAPGDPQTSTQHTWAELTATMNAHGGYFIGVDVGGPGTTFADSIALAGATGTVDGAGAAIAFHPGPTGLSGAANDIVNAVVTLAGQTPQDITTRTDPDRAETRLPAPHTTADFIRRVTPDHATPDMPTGYNHKDTTTFYAVTPSTIVWFNVDFYNDFQPSTNTAQLFRATIQVLGRAHSIVDHRDVYMIVPPIGGTPPPS